MKQNIDLVRYASYLGIEQPRIERRGRHPSLVGCFHGRCIRFAFSGTPSDWRTRINERSDLRRILGLTHSGKRLR